MPCHIFTRPPQWWKLCFGSLLILKLCEQALQNLYGHENCFLHYSRHTNGLQNITGPPQCCKLFLLLLLTHKQTCMSFIRPPELRKLFFVAVKEGCTSFTGRCKLLSMSFLAQNMAYTRRSTTLKNAFYVCSDTQTGLHEFHRISIVANIGFNFPHDNFTGPP